MTTTVRRKKLLIIPLAVVLLCTFGLASAAFAAGPGNQGNGSGHLPPVAQERMMPVDHAPVVDGVQHAMERIQSNVGRQVNRLGEVASRVPDQAKGAIEDALERMQDRIQSLLAVLSETR